MPTALAPVSNTEPPQSHVPTMILEAFREGEGPGGACLPVSNSMPRGILALEKSNHIGDSKLDSAVNVSWGNITLQILLILAKESLLQTPICYILKRS